MKAKARPGAKLLDLRGAEREYGIPYGTLYDLVKKRHLAAVELPDVRRIFLRRADLEDAIERWTREGAAR